MGARRRSRRGDGATAAAAAAAAAAREAAGYEEHRYVHVPVGAHALPTHAPAVHAPAAAGEVEPVQRWAEVLLLPDGTYVWPAAQAGAGGSAGGLLAGTTLPQAAAVPISVWASVAPQTHAGNSTAATMSADVLAPPQPLAARMVLVPVLHKQFAGAAAADTAARSQAPK